MADEKYRLQLEGDQIDDALMQMFLRAPEGWTQGTRDGVAVGSGSQYFHNNAKWFAEQAATSAARAEGAIPSGTAGAVFFDRSQSLTAAQQSQARANIMAGGSNRNLLDNWWWGTGVVNQRGNTTGEFGANTSVVDRWYTTYFTHSASSAWTVTSDGILLALSSGDNVCIKQTYNSEIPKLGGETVTISVKLSDGNVYSKTITRVNGTNQNVSLLGGALAASIRSDNVFWIQCYSGANGLTISAVKLELGPYSTLANDAPPNYAEELAKCQRYFIRYIPNPYDYPIGDYICPNATLMNCFMPLPVTLRANPKISSTITFKGVKPDGTTFTAGSINATGVARVNGVNFILNTSGQTAMSNGKLSTTTAGYIDFSADL